LILALPQGQFASFSFYLVLMLDECTCQHGEIFGSFGAPSRGESFGGFGGEFHARGEFFYFWGISWRCAFVEDFGEFFLYTHFL
jgi:hypothetical protein